jgi:hypothetical protein
MFYEYLLNVFNVNVFIVQAETMVAEWREFLWDIPEERAALWKHCHELFVRHSLPSLQVLFYVCMFVKRSLTLFSWSHDLYRVFVSGCFRKFRLR